MFVREDWKLFRNLNTLTQKSGVSINNLGKLVAKELVDNALDVSSRVEVGLLDKTIYPQSFFVKDYGNGLTKEEIEDLFAINRPMKSTKLLRLPSRGALGNGLRVIVGTVIATDGKIEIYSRSKKYTLKFNEDGTTTANETNSNLDDSSFGTMVEVSFGKVLDKDDILLWANETISLNTGTDFTCKTNAKWYDDISFFELCSAYQGTISELLKYFSKLPSLKKFKLLGIDKNFLEKKATELSKTQTDDLLKILKLHTKDTSYKELGELGDDYCVGGYSKVVSHFTPEWQSQSRFTGLIKSDLLNTSRIPYVVEVWVYNSKEPECSITINKTKITSDFNFYLTESLTLWGEGLMVSLKSKYKGLKINIISPYVPIISDGKAPDFQFFNQSIKECLAKATKSYKSMEKAMNNLMYGEKEYMSEKDHFFGFIEKAIAHTSGDGTNIFSQRQLYYSMRPLMMKATDKEPQYAYFCNLLTEYENIHGSIKGLYRDPRGTLYHPHLKEDISLGTLAVEEYNRPKWTFNKIIYSEKEGFFPILKNAKFPERYDCALLSSKGYASRAVKDLFDLLGETDEEILFFCIHDADSSGTKIYETLQEATHSRQARKIKVINLGLDPWEALEMGLEQESFPEKGKRAVAKYVIEADCDDSQGTAPDGQTWRNWLQGNRVELNAMSTPLFLKWLEGKISVYDNGKVVPEVNVLHNELEIHLESVLRKKMIDDILKATNFEELLDEKKNEMMSNYTNSVDIEKTINEILNKDDSKSWREGVRIISNQLTS